MVGGFAIVAYPATYAVSGVKTFIVNHEGVVYEKDLGPKTVKLRKVHEGVQPGQDLGEGGVGGEVDKLQVAVHLFLCIIYKVSGG